MCVDSAEATSREPIPPPDEDMDVDVDVDVDVDMDMTMYVVGWVATDRRCLCPSGSRVMA
jgi:hypothetical protein